MAKTLLADFSNKADQTQDTTGLMCTDEEKDLGSLMEEMKFHLSEAAGDLLQPRQEVIDQLLSKARGLH